MRHLLASLACLIPVAVQAEGEPAPSPQPSPGGEGENRPAFILEPGKPAEIACETKAVVVAEGAPAATKGALALKLERAEGEQKPQGRWSVVSVDAPHKASLAATQQNSCAPGCPLTLGVGGDIQLWAPAPKLLDALKEGEVLLLAVIRADATLRASTFKGPQIEALEEGRCKKVSP